MARPIPLDRLMRIMRYHSVELQHQIGSCPIQLSIPTDGKGVRVKVSVPSGYRSQIPDHVTFTLDGQAYDIPLETKEDFQSYVLQSRDEASRRHDGKRY